MPSTKSGEIKIELAKSSRSTCRTCHNKIDKDSPRIGIQTIFSLPDGNDAISYRFYHPNCLPFDKISDTMDFLKKKKKLKDINKKEIEKILLNLKSEGKNNLDDGIEQKEDSFLEYSKSNRSSCRECSEKIIKGEIRVVKPSLIELTDGRKIFGQIYFHFQCYLAKVNDKESSFNDLIYLTRKRQTISETDYDTIVTKYNELYSVSDNLQIILELIRENPIEIELLEKKAREYGVKISELKKKLFQGLEEGIYFQPTSETIQKL